MSFHGPSPPVHPHPHLTSILQQQRRTIHTIPQSLSIDPYTSTLDFYPSTATTTNSISMPQPIQLHHRSIIITLVARALLLLSNNLPYSTDHAMYQKSAPHQSQ